MTPTKNAALLWTGGKDSCLALEESLLMGYEVRCLITFTPKDPKFLAHPLEMLKMQSKAVGLPHHLMEIREPHRKGYEERITELKALGIDTLITGDIAEVGANPNWIRECSKPVGMEVLTPLWGRDRRGILEQLFTSGYEIIMSYAKTGWLTRDWVGRRLDSASLAELETLRAQNGLDLCGEDGEYHTLVLDAPCYNERISITSFSIVGTETFHHIEIHKMTTQCKT